MLFMEKMSLSWLLTTALVVVVSGFTDTEPGPAATAATPLGGDRFKIEGRAIVPGVKTQDWVSTARVLVDGEDYVGFLRIDGGFSVNDVPSGSYVVEVVTPSYRFEPVRVDITSKGKMRARMVNYIKTSEVIRQPYPLQIRSSGPHSYFMKRETWGWTDFLMNPMVMMMVLPLLIIVLLPKVVNTNDPEMRKVNETFLCSPCFTDSMILGIQMNFSLWTPVSTGNGAVHEHAEPKPGASRCVRAHDEALLWLQRLQQSQQQ
uniref:Endoplasmic reticulum membrane protein complex subunit 7 n=1 Tax=Oryzias latipes TaxID=8090 RepID=A0A3P9JDQ1_ORYLA